MLPPEPSSETLLIQGLICARLYGLIPAPGGRCDDTGRECGPDHPEYIPAEDPENFFSDPAEWPHGWTPGGGHFSR